MKNNKGFIFLETIIVTVVLTTTLIFLYSNFSKNVNDERRRLYYDDIAYIYKTIFIRNGIKSSINNEMFTKAINDGKKNNQNSLKNNFVFLFNSESKFCAEYKNSDESANMECSAENYKSIYIDNTYAKNLTELYNVKVLIYLKTSDLQDIKKCINEGKDGFTDNSTKKRCSNFLSFTNKYSESNLNDYLLTINNADANKNSIMLSLIYEKKNGELNIDKNYRSCLNNKILNSDKFNSYSTDKDKITAYYNQDDISYNMACANAYYISWVYYE